MFIESKGKCSMREYRGNVRTRFWKYLSINLYVDAVNIWVDIQDAIKGVERKGKFWPWLFGYGLLVAFVGFAIPSVGMVLFGQTFGNVIWLVVFIYWLLLSIGMVLNNMNLRRSITENWLGLVLYLLASFTGKGFLQFIKLVKSLSHKKAV